MSNISKISDLKQKSFRLKEKLVKNQLMPTNHSFSFSLQGLPKIATYYYGEKEISVNMISVKDTPLFYLGNFNVYSFYYNSYESDYGNKPRIITFEDFNENQVQFSGYGGSNPTETREDVFIKWWNFNTEEVSIQEVLRDLGNSIRKISGKTNKIPFIKMSYELESGMKDYVIPEGSIEITENGEHNVREFEKVNVDVPIPEGYLKPEGKVEITNTEVVDVTQYSEAQIVDENLKAENIAEGVEVLGIEGTFKGGVNTSDATATNDDLLLGKTAYANEQKLVGTIEDYDYSTSENVGVEYTDAFYKLVSGTLTEVDDDRVTVLKNYAFYYDSTLEYAKFENITALQSGVFTKCIALKEIDLPKCKYIYGSACFSGCESLTTINMPLLESATASNIFPNCIALKYVNFPSLTACGGSFLSACTSLETVDFGSIKIINASTFNNCSALKSVIIRTPSEICSLKHINAFTGSGIANGTGFIYVPDILVDSYKIATNWSTYASQIKSLSELEVE